MHLSSTLKCFFPVSPFSRGLLCSLFGFCSLFCFVLNWYGAFGPKFLYANFFLEAAEPYMLIKM